MSNATNTFRKNFQLTSCFAANWAPDLVLLSKGTADVIVGVGTELPDPSTPVCCWPGLKFTFLPAEEDVCGRGLSGRVRYKTEPRLR